jgi:predicted phage baseplate assembly protein
MSGPWWVTGSSVKPPAFTGIEPLLLPSGRASVIADVNVRTAAYTPEWTARTADDAGVALVTLFGGMLEPVLTRLNQLPLKAFVEALRIVGIDALAAEPASVQLQFTILGSATGPVLVPEGFQVGGRSTDGTGDLITFETQDDLYATTASITQMQVQEGSFFIDVTPDPTAPAPFTPFGSNAVPGAALYFGLSGGPPQLQFSIGFQVDTPAGTPAPVQSGGVTPLPTLPLPTLVWEAYDGASGAFLPITVNSDSTQNLAQSGVVVLTVPPAWRAGAPPGMDPSSAGGLLWFRLRIVQGTFDPPPIVVNVLLNVVQAQAVQTVTSEFVDFGTDTTLQHATLSQIPVLDGSLILTVYDDPLAATDSTVWTEVDDLQPAKPDDRVYELDPATGALTFGDGVRGAAIPPGFRNVEATYKVISPSSGVLTAGSVTTLINSAPFVTEVTNPNPSSGGTEVGSQAEAIARGPRLFRSRGRAVTTDDYALMATQAGGIVRAHAIAGRHPSYPGKPIAGVVGVYVVPPDTNPTPGQGAAPMPTSETLSVVANYLTANAAPVGVDVVVAPPIYHYIQAQVAVVANPSANAAAVYDAVLTALITYLHPIIGGSDGNGWPFGAPLLYTPLLLFLLAVPNVIAIPSLTLSIDGQLLKSCADFPINEDSLFWSLQHAIVPSHEEGGS